MPLTAEQIHTAADTLVEAGERPTLAAVRRAVGGGSFTTISEAMQVWHAQNTEAHVLAGVEVPDAVSDRLAQLQGALWQAALTEAEARLAAEREALREAEAESTAAVSEAREAVQTLEAEAEERERAIEALRTAHDDLSTRLATSEAARQSAERERAAVEAAASARTEGLEARLGDAQRVLETLVARVGEPTSTTAKPTPRSKGNG